MNAVIKMYEIIKISLILNKFIKEIIFRFYKYYKNN